MTEDALREVRVLQSIPAARVAARVDDAGVLGKLPVSVDAGQEDLAADAHGCFVGGYMLWCSRRRCSRGSPSRRARRRRLRAQRFVDSSVLHAARFSSECALFAAINCNAKGHRAHRYQNSVSTNAAEACQPPDSDACRAAALLCGARRRICGPAVEAAPHKGLQRPASTRQRGQPASLKI